mmetsp:Transcript_21231/g.54725  ORF Transcript_21231/g.54725 Transcript_21231/m.54725 type:complete len:483 (-) Transcript_21231:492-1940(-)
MSNGTRSNASCADHVSSGDANHAHHSRGDQHRGGPGGKHRGGFELSVRVDGAVWPPVRRWQERAACAPFGGERDGAALLTVAGLTAAGTGAEVLLCRLRQVESPPARARVTPPRRAAVMHAHAARPAPFTRRCTRGAGALVGADLLSIDGLAAGTSCARAFTTRAILDACAPHGRVARKRVGVESPVLICRDQHAAAPVSRGLVVEECGTLEAKGPRPKLKPSHADGTAAQLRLVRGEARVDDLVHPAGVEATALAASLVGIEGGAPRHVELSIACAHGASAVRSGCVALQSAAHQPDDPVATGGHAATGSPRATTFANRVVVAESAPVKGCRVVASDLRAATPRRLVADEVARREVEHAVAKRIHGTTLATRVVSHVARKGAVGDGCRRVASQVERAAFTTRPVFLEHTPLSCQVALSGGLDGAAAASSVVAREQAVREANARARACNADSACRHIIVHKVTPHESSIGRHAVVARLDRHH